jgi:hypothetical protein
MLRLRSLALVGLLATPACGTSFREPLELRPALTGYTGYPTGTIFFLPPGQLRTASEVAAMKARDVAITEGHYRNSLSPPDVFGLTCDCGAMTGLATSGRTAMTSALDCVPVAKMETAVANSARPTQP